MKLNGLLIAIECRQEDLDADTLNDCAVTRAFRRRFPATIKVARRYPIIVTGHMARIENVWYWLSEEIAEYTLNRTGRKPKMFWIVLQIR